MNVFKRNSEFGIDYYSNDVKVNEIIENINLISEPIVKFYRTTNQTSLLIYYYYLNNPLNRTIHRIDLNGIAITKNKFNWKRTEDDNKLKKLSKIVTYNNFNYFIIFDDRYNYESIDLVFIGYIKSIDKDRNFKFETFYQFPVYCAENYVDEYNLKHNLYRNLVDVYSDVNEFGISFYFIFRSIDNLVICYLDEAKINSTIKSYDKNDIKNIKCKDKDDNTKFSQGKTLCYPLPKNIPKSSMILKFDNKKFERILIKTTIDSTKKKKTSIIFLLDNLYRLHVYNLITNFENTESNDKINLFIDKLCFEGTYQLVNRKINKILDIYLDNEENTLIILTKLYLQKIPIQSFCSKTSFSSCSDDSTCNIGTKKSPICKNSKFKNRKCFSTLNTVEKMKSEPFLCDKEKKDMCLVTDTTNLTAQLKNDLLICNEESCLCESQYCLDNNCNYDSIEKKLCPLPKSSMELSKFSITYQLEPFYIIIFSKFVTLLVIAFTLISFYCCFSISQSKKTLADLAMISDLQSN